MLPVGGADDEIERLARTLNDLIRRLRASADRERQLVSDASHELRTPLAILKTQLELARTEASSVEQLVDDIRGAERSADRLTRLVGSLLDLSSLDAAEHPGESSAEDLRSEVDGAVGRARFRAGDRRRHPARFVVGCRGRAAAMAASPGGVRPAPRQPAEQRPAGARRRGGAPRRVPRGRRDDDPDRRGTGGGLDPAFVPHALDRFTRADESRRPGDGVGLGLAIVAAIVRNAGGTVELRNSPGEGLEVVVVLQAGEVGVSTDCPRSAPPSHPNSGHWPVEHDDSDDHPERPARQHREEAAHVGSAPPV